MPVQQMPNKLIGFDSQELKLLRELVDREKEVCRTTLRATGRWTDRLERYVCLLDSITEKIERKL